MLRAVISGLLVGAVVATLVAGAITGLDWRFNPGGIFHGEGGTDWQVVAATFSSWFWPVLLAVGLPAVAVFFWLERRSRARPPG